MARDEQHREEMMREATALVERVLLRVEGEPEPVVAGFRRDGCLSLYFGPDPVYQFNAAGDFRRGYSGGRLFKAHAGRVVGMTRERTAEATIMASRNLSAEEQTASVDAMRTRLMSLLSALRDGRYRVLESIPDGGGVAARTLAWLHRHAASPQIAGTAHAR